ncbi:PAS domain S-box protein [Fulvivirga sp. 29W222]|uniref:PAS domain S-box protein n=1 Tax=Fulvivirga marina TaxID=2494733 RepID=A0A937FZ17_9BACT|nr:PAS domain S-box protein [Fulvivirga marina]MBL6447113.1 PAS domain S-box protein [Fulvivirga marina]
MAKRRNNQQKSIFNEMGGKPVIQKMVELLLEKIKADILLKPLLNGNDAINQQAEYIKYFSFILGGRSTFDNKADFLLTDKKPDKSQIIAINDHLKKTLNELKIKKTFIQQIVDATDAFRAFAISDDTFPEQKQNLNKMAEGKKETIEKSKVISKSNNSVNLTSETMAKELATSVFDQLPADAQVKIKELDLKNKILDASCLISMTDKKGYITYINDKFCELAKYSREELIGQNHNIVRHPDMPKSVFKEVWATIGKGEMFNGFIKNKAKDGSYYWVDAYIAPIMGADGKPEAYIGVRFDITDLMEAKDEGSALKQAVDLSWSSAELGPDGTVLSANENFVTLMGYSSADEIIGQHHKIFCTSEDLKGNKCQIFWNDLGKGLSKSGEYKRLTKSGKEVWVNSAFTPVKDNNGKIVKIVKIAADVSEQVLEKQRNLQILEAAVDSVVTINSDKTITFFNKKAEEMFGYSRSEVLGKNIQMIVPLTHRQNHDQYIDDNMQTGVNKVIGISREFEMTRKDGSKFWGSLSLTKVEVSGNLQYTAFIKDITEERENKMKADNVQAAVDTGWASIEFEPDGTILSVNENFARTLNYSIEELVGNHHQIFVDDTYAKSAQYKKFWKDLANGEVQAGEFARITKNGELVWLNASYTPVTDSEGHVIKVIKIANDITDMVDARKTGENIQAAVDTGWASIEFEPDGTILSVNENFARTLNYSIEELVGNHHQIFVDDTYAKSAQYKKFWKDLANGEVQAGEFARITKNRELVWLNASYTPVTDSEGTVIKVIKIANDITDMVDARKTGEDLQAAVDTGWASIEFEPNGTILSVNENFARTLNYSIEELVGNHHQIFVDDTYAKSAQYKKFWKDLANGEVQAGEFARITKNGELVWLNASYTPVTDSEGHVIKVIKIANDITDMVDARKKGENIQAAVDTGWAYIEFDIDGTIIEANDAFLNTLGYNNIKEVKNQHHSIFVDSTYASSMEYTKFWKDLARGEVQNGEFARIKKNGETAWLQAAYTPIKDDNGQVARVIKIATDISKIKMPVLAVSDIVNKLAEGDLTNEFNMDADGYVKEMGEALNKALENLNSLLYTINEVSTQVSDSADNLQDRSQSMKNNTNEMASAIAQMSRGAQDQAEKTDESSNLSQQVLTSAEEMEKRAEMINKTAEDGQKSSENGLKIVKTLVENMEGISSSASLTSDSIEVLTQRAEEIGRTLNVITDIAAQTNLLALNAAIEAARAGDAGRGFAVVAEEIRKLAEDSRKSAVDIEKIIADVQKDTQSAGKAIDTMGESVKHGNAASSEVETIFKEIAASSEVTFDYSREILNSAKGQKDAIDSVVKNIEQIVVVAEETASGTQQVASSSQELDTSMEEITAASEQLASVSTELQASVNQFKLRETKAKL